MELKNQIKKYRTNMNMSQEELADRIFVTRQSISNWETGKNYPDIHSLLLMSSLFDVSLDQLIKGDLDIMKEEINKEYMQQFKTDSNIFTILLFLLMVIPIPLIYCTGKIIGFGVFVLLFVVTMIYAIKIEKYKKDNDIQSYKEIVAFMEGKHLDEIQKSREIGKRPYQKFLLAIGCGIITIVIGLLFIMIFEIFS